MASIRRSARVSNISKAAPAPHTPKTTSKQRTKTEIWRRRQTASDSDDEKSESDNELLTQTDDSNSENLDILNKMKQQRQSTKAKHAGVATMAPAVVEPKTPRRKKVERPTSASKKRDLLCKRKSDDSEDDKNDLTKSPTKQSRKQSQATPQHQISPTRLLDRLSIDERKEADDKQTSPALEPESPRSSKSTSLRSKYQNARRSLNNAETHNLPGREQQLQALRDFFTEHLLEQRSGSLYVSGPPGTGKTACLSLLLRAPEFANRIQRVYINCTSIASISGIYKKLCNELQLCPAARNERDYLHSIQEHLRSSKRMLLLVLDEIDQLCSGRQSVLYTIFEWPALPGAKLLLVGIANSLDLTDRALVRLNARCELKPRLMHFPPYTKQQIVDIFKSRLEEANVLDVFPPVTLQLLAAKVSAVSGDVRRALDIGRRVVELAEQQKNVTGEKKLKLNALQIDKVVGEQQPEEEESLKPVEVTQVAAVLNNVYGASQQLQEDIEESFPLQQKLMLCSLMLMLCNERNKDISIPRLHEVYRRVCAKRNILPLDQTEFSGLVDLVETRGILRIIRKKEPRLNKVRLQWDEEEVNGALRDKQLIASILDDTACLGK